MQIKIGEKYRYRIGNTIINTYFLIERFENSRYVGRAMNWAGSVWYFDENGVQIGTEHTPNEGTSNVCLIIK